MVWSLGHPKHRCSGGKLGVTLYPEKEQSEAGRKPVSQCPGSTGKKRALGDANPTVDRGRESPVPSVTLWTL